MQQESSKRVHVVAAVICDYLGNVLLAKRSSSSHLGGYWEFPGGKLIEGESAQQALIRELREELGITIQNVMPLISVPHDYVEKKIQLDVYLVDRYEGTPVGMEGQVLRWVLQSELSNYKLPPADYPVLKALQFPKTYAISTDHVMSEHKFCTELSRVLSIGTRLIQLRKPKATWPQLKRMAELARPLCKQFNASLLINTAPKRWQRDLCDGIHLNSIELMKLDQRPLPVDVLVGASCHNEIELQQACKIGVDFVVLSAVKATQSHPYSNPIGWAEFGSLVEKSTVPVYALGGVSKEDIPMAKSFGAQGVAGIREFWA